MLYGNIGSGNRLDFTCIGPAVNLAARIEKLASRLGRTILASQEFAKRYCPGDLGPIGKFAVAGFAEKQPFSGSRRRCWESTGRTGMNSVRRRRAARAKGPSVWLDMDQSALDDAYDQLVYAPNRDQVVARRVAASERARAILGPPQRVAYGPSEYEQLDILPQRHAERSD